MLHVRDPCERVRELGQTEIQELHMATGTDKDVGGLDVPMKNTLVVCRGERARDLLADLEHLGFVEAPFGKPRFQAASLQKLQHEKRSPFGLFDIVNRADVEVVEGGGETRFTPEAIAGFAIVEQIVRKKLQRNAAAKLRILRSVDDPHATLAQFFQDAILGDNFSLHDRACLRRQLPPALR